MLCKMPLFFLYLLLLHVLLSVYSCNVNAGCEEGQGAAAEQACARRPGA